MTRDDRSLKGGVGAAVLPFLLFTLLPPAGWSQADRVVERVGPEAITALEVERAMAREPHLSRQEVLDHLAERELVLLYAKEKKISVSDEEAERSLLSLAKKNGMGREEFLQEVEKRGIAPAAYMKDFKTGLLLTKAAQAALADRVSVTDVELEARWREEYPPIRTLTIRHIFFPLPPGVSPDAESKTKAEAQELARSIRSREVTFADAARTRSGDPSSARAGGVLGTFQAGELDPVLEKTASSLSPGEVSDPVRGPDGIHLLMLDKKEEKPPAPLASVRDELAAMIRSEKGDKAQREWLKELREKWVVEILPDEER